MTFVRTLISVLFAALATSVAAQVSVEQGVGSAEVLATPRSDAPDSCQDDPRIGSLQAYELLVGTPGRDKAGTDANVEILVRTTCNFFTLAIDAAPNLFERNSVDRLTFVTQYGGEIRSIRIKIIEKGYRPGWFPSFLDFLEVDEDGDLQVNTCIMILRWIASSHPNGTQTPFIAPGDVEGNCSYITSPI